MTPVRKLWAGVGRDLVLNTVIASPIVPTGLRWVLLRAVGMRVERSGVASRVWFGSRRMAVGRGTYIGHGAMFDTFAPISIGRDCAIAMQTTFVTSTHRIGGPHKRAGVLETRPIVVGDGVWIGARATVLPGVTIGDGAVVAAGAVVTRDCDPHTLYAGVPARAIRTLPHGAGAPVVVPGEASDAAAGAVGPTGTADTAEDARPPRRSPGSALPHQLARDDHAVRVAHAFREAHTHRDPH